MTKRHVIKKASEAEFQVETGVAPDSSGYSRWRAVGYDDGAAHTDFGRSRLAPGGVIPTHVHSFEEQFNLISGGNGAPRCRRLRSDSHWRTALVALGWH